MDKLSFKSMFSSIAIKNGFKKAYGGWYQESDECIIVLELQKSSYSILYYLNIKIYIQGVFDKSYKISKAMVSQNLGTSLDTRPDKKYSYLLDLENGISDITREIEITKMFENYVTPLVTNALSKEGIKKLVDAGLLFNLPAIMNQI